MPAVAAMGRNRKPLETSLGNRRERRMNQRLPAFDLVSHPTPPTQPTGWWSLTDIHRSTKWLVEDSRPTGVARSGRPRLRSRVDGRHRGSRRGQEGVVAVAEPAVALGVEVGHERASWVLGHGPCNSTSASVAAGPISASRSRAFAPAQTWWPGGNLLEQRSDGPVGVAAQPPDRAGRRDPGPRRRIGQKRPQQRRERCVAQFEREVDGRAALDTAASAGETASPLCSSTVRTVGRTSFDPRSSATVGTARPMKSERALTRSSTSDRQSRPCSPSASKSVTASSRRQVVEAARRTAT